MTRLSRRDLLTRAALTGTAFAVASVAPEGTASPAGSEGTPSGVPTLETLTAAESETLEAIVARLIPADGSGPGATEARAAHYIDRALGGPLASSREAYTSGLAALDAHAERTRGARFARLPPVDQDTVLGELEENNATGFAPSAAAFFTLVRAHTIEGTFSDPYHGGNANFVGWDLIGYPGVRLSVTADDQRIDARVTPNHRSAYDFPMFSNAKASGGG